MDVLSRLARDAASVSDYNQRLNVVLGRDLRLRPLTVDADLVLALLDALGAADGLRAAAGDLPMACAGDCDHRHDPASDPFCRLHDQAAAYDRIREASKATSPGRG